LKASEVKIFRKFFRNYVNKFYLSSEDEEVKANLKLKEIHTSKVYRNINFISKSLNLSQEEINLAKSIALFHDIGRFEQLIKYKTFLDRNSENHSEIGLRILKEEGILKCIDENERNILIDAIRYHNVRKVPEIKDKSLFFCKLIRDADKIDIIRVWIDYFEGKENFDPSYGFNLSKNDGYSRNIIKDIFENKISPIENVKTYNDIKLLLLTWIYDINFTASLRIILKRKYIQKIFKILPENEEIKKVSKHINNYILNFLSTTNPVNEKRTIDKEII